jgi:low affinity Fe/Cu permease
MSIARILGVLIIFGILFIVLGGALWHFTESWNVVLIGEVVTFILITFSLVIQRKKPGSLS